jgi:hypothetical protein
MGNTGGARETSNSNMPDRQASVEREELDPAVFANRVVVRKPLQAFPFGLTAGRIHSSLRGRRQAAARWGQKGTGASIS